MAQLPTNRTTSNTAAEHVVDHNELATLHNVFDATAASRLIGRKASGALGPLTAAEALTILAAYSSAQTDTAIAAAIANLVDASPGALDTLNELAAALGDDANFAATMTTALATKAPIASPTFTGVATAPSVTASGKTGATSTPITLAGGTVSGAPSSGAHLKGEVVLDDAGAAWYCTVAGTPGTWTQVGGLTASQGAAPNALTGAPTLTAWYKADAITGKVDGDPISQWDDSSGNALHVVQATGANQPTYKASASLPWLNGKPAVRFDGSDWLAKATTGLGAGSAFTVAAVVNRKGTAASGVFTGYGTSNLDLFFESNKWSVRGGSTPTAVDGGTFAAQFGLHLLVGVYDGAQVQFFIDGLLAGYVAATGTVTPTNIALGAITTSGTYPLEGDIAEVAFYSAALTPAQRDQLTRHMAWKYALPVVPPF